MFLQSLALAFLACTAVTGAEPRIIVEVDPAKAATVAFRYHLSVESTFTGERGAGLVVSPPRGVTSAQVASALATESGVKAVEVDKEVKVGERPESTKLRSSIAALPPSAFDRQPVNFRGVVVRSGYVSQPATTLVNADAAVARYGPGGGIVAVIDTGVDPFHPALRDSLLPGYDFTRDLFGIANDWLDLNPVLAGALAQSTVAILDQKSHPITLNQSTVAILDQSTVAILDQSTVAILDSMKMPAAFGHGTMVAGLIHRIAPGAKILPLKAFAADGSARLSDIVRAIRYATDHGAAVINMSFDLTSASAELTSALTYAKAKGVILVASAGNTGSERPVLPATFSGVIGVGSTNPYDVRSAFSNYDSNAKTSAPGEAVLTTYPGNNYAGVWGTSFSAAMVSGTAALMYQTRGTLKADKLRDALDHGQYIGSQEMGDSRLDVLKCTQYYVNSTR